ncbi:MAG: hypothetical protein Pg6A_06340 [Termitinemataceae bacterium]|nr:MAG: hypothetical protein Pg6A_06340 [Termitinemataceae bacterium]
MPFLRIATVLLFALCVADVFGQTVSSSIKEANTEEVIRAIEENCEKFQWLAVIALESTEDMGVPYLSMHRLAYDRGGTGFNGLPLKAEIVYIKTIKDGERWLLTIDFFDSPRREKNAMRTRDARRNVLALLSSLFPEKFEVKEKPAASGE